MVIYRRFYLSKNIVNLSNFIVLFRNSLDSERADSRGNPATLPGFRHDAKCGELRGQTRVRSERLSSPWSCASVLVNLAVATGMRRNDGNLSQRKKDHSVGTGRDLWDGPEKGLSLLLRTPILLPCSLASAPDPPPPVSRSGNPPRGSTHGAHSLCERRSASKNGC